VEIALAPTIHGGACDPVDLVELPIHAVHLPPTLPITGSVESPAPRMNAETPAAVPPSSEQEHGERQFPEVPPTDAATSILLRF
jgi:hypothetical protein